MAKSHPSPIGAIPGSSGHVINSEIDVSRETRAWCEHFKRISPISDVGYYLVKNIWWHLLRYCNLTRQTGVRTDFGALLTHVFAVGAAGSGTRLRVSRSAELLLLSINRRCDRIESDILGLGGGPCLLIWLMFT